MFKLKSFIFLLFAIVLIFALPTTTLAQVDPNLRTRLQNQGAIIVDHTNLNLFEQIPPTYLQRARNIRVVFSDRSVGQNISSSLDCMAASSWIASPGDCRKAFDNLTTWHWRGYDLAAWNAGIVPPEIQFYPSSTNYNRSNITYVFQGGSWADLTNH